MKRILYISFLVIFLLQSGGLLLVYQFQQSSVQHEMLQALNSKKVQFEKLSISLSDFQKGSVSSHEVTVNGRLYDVKSHRISGNRVELLVISDTKEENIIENIKKSVNTDSQPNNELPNHLIRLLSLVYISPLTVHVPLMWVQQPNTLSSVCENFISHQPEILTPPPKSV